MPFTSDDANFSDESNDAATAIDLVRKFAELVEVDMPRASEFYGPSAIVAGADPTLVVGAEPDIVGPAIGVGL